MTEWVSPYQTGDEVSDPASRAVPVDELGLKFSSSGLSFHRVPASSLTIELSVPDSLSRSDVMRRVLDALSGWDVRGVRWE